MTNGNKPICDYTDLIVMVEHRLTALETKVEALTEGQQGMIVKLDDILRHVLGHNGKISSLDGVVENLKVVVEGKLQKGTSNSSSLKQLLHKQEIVTGGIIAGFFAIAVAIVQYVLPLILASINP